MSVQHTQLMIFSVMTGGRRGLRVRLAFKKLLSSDNIYTAFELHAFATPDSVLAQQM